MSEIPPWYRDLLKQGLAQPGDLRPQVPIRYTYLEQFRRRMEGKFWKSPDITLFEDAVLEAGKEQPVPIIIPLLTFVPFVDMPTDTLAFAQISTRSRFAQLGIEVARDTVHEIVRDITSNDRYITEKGLLTKVPVINRASRRIRIPQGVGLFQFYYESSPCVQDKELMDLVESGAVSIDGEKGKDWDYDVLFDEYVNSRRPVGIRFRLDSKRKLWLPPKRIWLPGETEEKPIEIPDTPENDYRRVIDGFLQPVPSSEKPIHWIGETISRLKLDPNVNAVIVAVNSDEWRHVNSLLIEGGTDWKIRTEIVSPTVSNAPTDIFLHFYT